MRNIRKCTGVLLAVLLVMSLSVSVFANSQTNKSNCGCQIRSFSVQVDGIKYTANGNNTFSIEKTDQIDLQQIYRDVSKDPKHKDVHPTELSYSFDDSTYHSIKTIGESESSPVLVGTKLDFRGKSDIYFKLEMKERNDTVRYIHLKVYQEYKITYHLDGGTMQGNPETFTEATDTFKLKDPTKDGYKFLGWTGTGLDMMTADVTIEKGSGGDRVYTANWEKEEAASETTTTTTEKATTEKQTDGSTKNTKETKEDKKQKDSPKKDSNVTRTGDDSAAERNMYIGISIVALIIFLIIFMRRKKK